MSERRDFSERVILGRTGLQVGRLGLGSSYEISQKSCERAFDEGVNYFLWGSVRTEGMARAIKTLSASRRSELVVALQAFGKSASLVRRSVEKGLSILGLDYADVLILGWHDKAPKPAISEAANELKARGLCRHIGLSTHHRPLVPELLKDQTFELFHFRYNAAHPGAEKDIFPYLPEGKRPGTVAFTNTRWGHLLDPKRMPSGKAPLTAAQCYRFALSNRNVDVTLTGPKNDEELDCALSALAGGPLSDEEMSRALSIGRHVHDAKTLGDRLNPLV